MSDIAITAHNRQDIVHIGKDYVVPSPFDPRLLTATPKAAGGLSDLQSLSILELRSVHDEILSMSRALVSWLV